jgi:outer membrane protein OmpA-like peptidoglycan-associated protein
MCSLFDNLRDKQKILKAKGYGESKPKIATPLKEEEHAMNRRVEFEIKKIYR